MIGALSILMRTHLFSQCLWNYVFNRLRILGLEMTKWNVLIKQIFPINYRCSVSVNICTAIQYPNSQKKGAPLIDNKFGTCLSLMFTYLCGRFDIYIYIYIWNSIMFNLIIFFDNLTIRLHTLNLHFL